MSDKDTKIELEQEECYCGIPEFYNLIARKLGYEPQKVQFDCTKICVSKAVQNQIFSFYKTENKASGAAIGQTWVKYGPKANLPYAACVVSIEKDSLLRRRKYGSTQEEKAQTTTEKGCKVYAQRSAKAVDATFRYDR